MGYTLKIGNAVAGDLPTKREVIEDWGGQIEVQIGIKTVILDNAPADGSPTDHENQRWPSYSAWHDFAQETGLHRLFFDEQEGLMRAHPGCFIPTPDHLTTIKSVATRVPELHRGRYDWLLFWVEWALANFDPPAIKNT